LNSDTIPEAQEPNQIVLIHHGVALTGIGTQTGTGKSMATDFFGIIDNTACTGGMSRSEEPAEQAQVGQGTMAHVDPRAARHEGEKVIEGELADAEDIMGKASEHAG
jgi:hypothetical protein